MPTAYRSITALLVSVLLVVAGQGTINTVVPLAAKLHGYSDVEIGLLSSAYFVGMLLGAIANPSAVRHAGHVRAFTASIAISSITALAYTFAPEAWFWILLRGLGGFAIAGLYATVEGWLQGRSDNSTRGRVMAIYSVVQYVGWALGNVFLHVAEPLSFTLFAIAAMMFCSGIIPITVTEQAPPERPTARGLPFVWLLQVCPLGVIGVFLVGFANGPMWSLMPIFGTDVGLTSAEVGTMMMMLTLGSAALQFPIGRLSDTFDRRLLAAVLVVITIFVEFVLWQFGAVLPHLVLYALSFALGAVVSTQYYVLGSYTNDRTGPAHAVGVSSVLLFAYCSGAIIGPSTGAAVMSYLGPASLYLHDGVVHFALAVFILVTMMAARRSARAEAAISRMG